MNSRQLQYAILLSQVRSFSQVAEQLNISQPALSKQILNLENDLGVKLFDRNSIPLTLTPAGEHFIQEAKLLLYKENQLLRSMERFKSGDQGRLVIGISPFRSLYLIPEVISKLKTRFPGIQVVLHEAGSEQLRKGAAEGKYDFSIVNLPVDESVLDIRPLEPDTLVLAVPSSMAKDLRCSGGSPYPEIEFAVCRELPFVVVGQSQEMRQLFEKLCAESDFQPNIAAEVVGIASAWAMAQAGIGATLLPLQFLNGRLFEQDLSLFRIKNIGYSRQPAIITKRGQYIPEYARYAMDLLTEFSH